MRTHISVPGEPRTAAFGAGLRAARTGKTIPSQRGCSCASPGGRQPRTVAEMVARLKGTGCAIDGQAYRAIEAGAVLPEEPERFLDTVADALGLGEHEALALLWVYAYSVLEAELGCEIAAHVLPAPPSRPP